MDVLFLERNGFPPEDDLVLAVQTTELRTYRDQLAERFKNMARTVNA